MNQSETPQTTLTAQYAAFGISEAVLGFARPVLEQLRGRFEMIDETAEYNQLRVIRAMQENHIGEAHLKGTTGYGYDDIGRDGLERVYASYFGTEDALVRPQISCGTHALALALMGNLRPGDILVSAAGKPYDTLEEVIGIRPSRGSLAEYGIRYRQVDLKADGSFDFEGIRSLLAEDSGHRIRLVTIQRSKGYQTRRTLSVTQIGEAISFIKKLRPDVTCMVDNCYGEFVERIEPSHLGADMVVGSLIKNPGGGLAPTGGYVVGKQDAIERISYRLTAPGIGLEVGSYAASYQPFYQGLFMAPHTVAQAIKTACLAARVFEDLGMTTTPASSEPRADIIQAIQMRSPERLIAFCQGIQMAAPIDSMALPEPWAMPGYTDEVIMAAGTFVSGASVELSADAPMREPYTAYMQGGLTYAHGRIAIAQALQRMVDQGALTL